MSHFFFPFSEIVRALEISWNITLDIGMSNNSIETWDEKDEVHVGAIDKEFHVVHDAWCKHGILLHPEDDEWDAFRIFKNGSLYFNYSEIDAIHRLVPPGKFCIIPIVRRAIQ
jgi:hypothetical protein